MQEPPLPPGSAWLAKAWNEHFELGALCADVQTFSGHILSTTAIAPTLWTDSFPPYAAVEPVLPDPQTPNDPVGFKEVFASDTEATNSASLLRRPRARQNTREFVRGSTVSMPFTPGGEAVEAVSTAASKAAEEAATGSWLKQLESGSLPRITAPGLSQGWFGPWETKEDALDHSDAAGEAAPFSALPNGASAVSGLTEEQEKTDANVALEDLFRNVWMAEEEEPEPQAATPEKHVPDTEILAPHEETSVLTQLANLPDNFQIEGAVDQHEDGLAKEALDNVLQAGIRDLTPWAQHGSAPPSPLPKKKSEYDWAMPGGFPDLEVAFNKLRPNLAHKFPFELDPFQKEAVLHLEQGHSVFVAAHTSAGKTVVAEYAFALATKHCTRAIYTSPIKTISNQKFRDFGETFETGLLTGDVSLKPESSCLIMTTEILRSMLYKGADIIRDIEFVVFDEVHYVNDAERGVVWEEVIIMLPAHVTLILLSATVPNVMEFADWVGRTKRRQLFVSGTLKRPVPLEHNLYYNGQLYNICRQDTFLGEGFSQAKLAWNKKNAIPTTNKEAKAQRPDGRGDGGARGGRAAPNRGGGRAPTGQARAHIAAGGRGQGANSNSGLRTERTQWLALIDQLNQKKLLPVVVFVFSRKRIDQTADNLNSLDLTTASEKAEIHIFVEQSVSRLKGGDRRLPQIIRLKQMLKRGLGVHHAGLLPIMKEVVEMLFCRGLIKVLFSTETFAMGVNAPARTVVFQSLRKHDGKSFRNLLSGEYTQMAGRAGRRGLDPVGTVIIACWDDVPDEGDVRKMMTGKATKLESQFRLTYSMILNLLRVEDLKVEDMLKRSFAEFHAQRSHPEALQKLAEGKARLDALRAKPWPHSPHATSQQHVQEYYHLSEHICALTTHIQEAVMSSRGAQQALVPGRMVITLNQRSGLPELGVVCGSPAAATNISTSSGLGSKSSGFGGLQPSQSPSSFSAAAPSGGRQYYVLSLHRDTPLDQQAAPSEEPTEAPAGGGQRVSNGFDDGFAGLTLKGGKGAGAKRGPVVPQQGQIAGTAYMLQQVDVNNVEGICKQKLRLDSEAVLGGDNQQALAVAVTQLQRSYEEAAAQGGDPPVLDPVADLKLNQLEVVDSVRERQRLMQVRASMACHRDPALGEMYALVRSQGLLESRLRALAHQVSDANLQQMPDFQQRIEVLRQLEYIAHDNTVQLKGRVACEINSGDELASTELIFGGVLTQLTPEEAVAVLSALVFQEKSDVEAAAATPALAEARETVIALTRQAGKVQQECGLDILPDEFARGVLKWGLMEVVYEWARGTPFEEICELTDVMEGSIVRTIVRLDEVCREFRDAARVMGNTQLFQQMEQASAAIKRDVIFAASLYVS
ncbi:hypothetical protein WJX79_004816 [Trebouxia sp. C0005]